MKARLWGAEAQCVQWIVLLFNNMSIVQLTKQLKNETAEQLKTDINSFESCELWQLRDLVPLYSMYHCKDCGLPLTATKGYSSPQNENSEKQKKIFWRTFCPYYKTQWCKTTDFHCMDKKNTFFNIYFMYFRRKKSNPGLSKLWQTSFLAELCL